MPERSLSAQEVLQKIDEQLQAALVEHQDLTSRALVCERQFHDAFLPRQLAETAQTPESGSAGSSTNILREALYDLESLLVRFCVTGQLVSCQSELGIELTEKEELSNLASLSQGYCRSMSLMTASFDNPSDKKLIALASLADEVKDTVSSIQNDLDQLDQKIVTSYKESLLAKMLALNPAEQKMAVERNSALIASLEQYTTRHREEIVLWLTRTEIAYGRENETLAIKAWHRKEELGQGLAMLEAALVAHVEAGAIVKQKIEQSS